MMSSEDSLFARPMELADISQVAEIEREAFPEPWPATDFRRELTFNRSSYYMVVCAKPPEGEGSELEAEDGGCQAQHLESKLVRLRSGLRRLFAGEREPAVQEQLILGYAGLWSVVDEVHLANIAVRAAYRRQGIGELLLSRCIEVAVERNARFITLEVRASNYGAQALYEKYGFARVGIRPGYYTDNKEDAVIMTADMIKSASFQGFFQKLKQSYAQRWGNRY